MTLFPIAASRLSKNLGYGMPISSILSSAAFTVCLFFYLYIIGSFFRITVYPLINRVTFHTVFEEHIVNEQLDYIIAIVATTLWFLLSVNNRAIRYCFSIAYGGTGIILAIISRDYIIFDIVSLLSLPLIISVTLYYHKRQKNIVNFNAKLTLRYISLAVIAISAIGILFEALTVFITPHLDSSSPRDSHANELFLLLSSFSPIYIVLLVFCLSVKVLFKEALGILKLDVKEDITQDVSNNHVDNNNNNNNRLKKQTKIGFLVLAMILSIVLVLIPQHPSINKDNQDIGVDTSYYLTWIGELAKSKSISDFAYQAFVVQGQDGTRPLSLIFLFLIYQIAGGNLSEVIEHSPIILGPGIVLAFYFLTLELTRNEKIALIAAFLGAVSLHTLVGIYAGFYANWLALIVGYISIVFLFRYLRSGRLSDIVVFSALLIGVLFFHVYTWTLLAAVAAVFLVVILLVVMRRKKKKKNNNNNNSNDFTKRRIIWLLLAILVSIVVDISKVVLTGSSGGIEQDIELAQTNLGIEQFNLRWQILNGTIHDGVGGVFSNFIILILGLVWVLKSNIRDPGTVFLMIFLSAGLVALFFGSWSIQARVFYNMPFEIPAAIALYYISSRSGSILTTLAACTWLVAVSLFTVMNYYLIPVLGMRSGP
jgi:hypothetical protein